MEYIRKKAYSKINLYLDVLSRYPDGYHEVFTVMQSLSLCDDIEISFEDSFRGIKVECDDVTVPTDERNIVYKAAHLFFRALKKELENGLKINITKRIPVSAGLGGGSADAACVLSALNEICGMPLPWQKLLEIGASIGADVPFCMTGGCAYATGKGDLLSNLSTVPECFVVVARGGEGVSTPLAYSSLDKKYDNFSAESYKPHNPDSLLSALADSNLKGLCENLYNIFEESIFAERPIAKKLKEKLFESGACGGLMSGSGTAVFGIFDRLDDAKRAEKEIKSLGYFATVATPIRSFN